MRSLKIGIITFHWGTNYGGILQCYALQEYLSEVFNSRVEIINYAPKTYKESLFKVFLTRKPIKIVDNLKVYIKDITLDKFRKEYLNRTKRYYSYEELKYNSPYFDVYICGSDQVWNPSIMKKHGAPYYLNFGNKDSLRISYAASFGSINYPNNKKELLKSYLSKFDGISVRETGGVRIVNEIISKKIELLPDPVLLLDKNKYIDVIDRKNYSHNNSDHIFIYALQSGQKKMINTIKFLGKKTDLDLVNTNDLKYYFIPVEEWLHYHNTSRYVITNSYHGVLFSLIFHKKFLVFPIEGHLEGMNDRLYTILEEFQLMDRLVDSNSTDQFIGQVNKPINWEYVDRKINQLRVRTLEYFSRYL